MQTPNVSDETVNDIIFKIPTRKSNGVIEPLRERKRMAKKLLRKALDSRDVKLNNLWIPGFSQKVGLLLQVM